MIKLPYKKLLVWQKAMDLAKFLFKITKTFPREEIYGLTSQMRRSAISIVSNIAEGSQRGSDKEFCNFILIAKGSLAELETQLILSGEFDYIPAKDLDILLSKTDELSKMLHSFKIKLSADR